MAYTKWAPQVASSFVKWTQVGQSFEGVFQGLGEDKYEGRPTYHADFLDLQGRPVRVNTPSALRRDLAMAPTGKKLKLTYTHTKQGKHPQPIKMFSIEIDDDKAELSYADLAAMLKQHRGDAADAQLTALDQLHGDDFVEKRKHLVQMLKTAGVAL